MNKPYAVVFSGVPGSSKSIVAHELSCQFSLGILSTDNIRFEVKEDMRKTLHDPVVQEEFEQRYEQRWRGFLSRGNSLIRDGSVDRTWPEVKAELDAAGYDFFMVSMELTKGFMKDLYLTTNRPIAAQQLEDHYQAEHDAFIREYGDAVNVSITDELFPLRREVAVAGLHNFLEKRTIHSVAI